MQTKIGFDKFPVPSISSEVPLNDIVTGEKLVDQGGIPLVTESETFVTQVTKANRATSTVLDPATIEPLRIEEVFKETTETSTTLLGINRAETQLSLFSDVSVIGLDEDHWEVFNFVNYYRYFPWDLRGTKSFGNHYDASMSEETQEQAIRIGCFPVPYSYPWPQRFADQGLHRADFYQQYKNFIDLGNTLYTYFAEQGRQLIYGSDFKDKFLDPDNVTITGDELEYNNVTEAEGLVLIDEWTRTWVDILSNLLYDPSDPTNTRTISSTFINSITNDPGLAFENTRPGYRSNHFRYSLMQSRKAFRYQPGRISGYTFGAKSSSDSGSSANVLEWGIGNPSDQYVFQVKGANFSIVRRSTVPLEAPVLIRNGLSPADQTLEANGDPFDIDPDTDEPRLYYTITIPRDLFNNDTVDGNGPSGYLLNPAYVTMYKIEFGWYGAIGARFYAYVPVDNNEGRWIALHTLVIENSLGRPCLEDPFFKFRYSVSVADASTLRTPQFIYKYGASMYIDGGDEGTVTQHSYTSPVRAINAAVPKSLIGIYPKPVIISADGIEKPNKKTIIPKQVSVYSDVLTKVDIIKCRACPGFGHNYNEGLQTGVNGRSLNIKFLAGRNKFVVAPDDPLDPNPAQLLQLSDNGAKIVADGLWSGYVEVNPASEELDENQAVIGYTEAFINRIISTQQIGGNELRFILTKNASYPDQVISKTTGLLMSVPANGNTVYPYPIRLSNYSAVAGSSVPLTGSQIQIQFLNPISRDPLGHFNDFIIGITDKKPILVNENGDDVLKWVYAEGDERTELPKSDMLYGEWTQSTSGRDRAGYERNETVYPAEHKMEISYRIQPLSGSSGGFCSAVNITVLDRSQLTGIHVSGNPETNQADGFWYIKLTSGVRFPTDTIVGGEVGINGVGTGVRFTSEQESYIDEDGEEIFYARISGALSGIGNNIPVNIQLTPVELRATHISANKIFGFNPSPLYLVIMLRDGGKVNSISVSEKIGDLTVSSSPKWVINDKMVIDNIGGLASPDLPPVNFASQDRLDSAAIDTQLEQRLRPGTTIDTFFVGANGTAKVDLKSIYGQDRESITADLLNIEATFFVGSVIPVSGQPSTGLVQISLNTAEQ